MSFLSRFKQIWSETVQPLRPIIDGKDDGPTDRALDAIITSLEIVGKPPAVQGSIFLGGIAGGMAAVAFGFLAAPALLILGATNAFARALDRGNSDLEKDFIAGALLIPAAAASIAMSPFLGAGYLIHAAQVAMEAAGFGKLPRPFILLDKEDAAEIDVAHSSPKSSLSDRSSAPGFNSNAAVPAAVPAVTPLTPAPGRKLTP